MTPPCPAFFLADIKDVPMRRCHIGLLVVGLLLPGHTGRAQTLDAIRAAHHMQCGTVQAVGDWNADDVHGDLSALEAEVCRAVAVAILGSTDGLTIHSFPGEQEALQSLKAGEIELAVGISPSAETAIHFGVGFSLPVFFDSQRLMVSRYSGVEHLDGLRDGLICALDMSPPERALRDEMTARGIPYSLMSHSEQGEMDAAIAVRHCVAGTAMESRLAQSRANFHALVSDFVFLPERLGVSPIVAASRYGDLAFELVVDWTISALIEAEALEITKSRVAAAFQRDDMRAGQLLGHDFAVAQALGLAHDWAGTVIGAVGNYGEIFAATAGKPYRLDRGLNDLWIKGGLMRPMPMR